jgi:hypothetical protein
MRNAIPAATQPNREKRTEVRPAKDELRDDELNAVSGGIIAILIGLKS